MEKPTFSEWEKKDQKTLGGCKACPWEEKTKGNKNDMERVELGTWSRLEHERKQQNRATKTPYLISTLSVSESSTSAAGSQWDQKTRSNISILNGQPGSNLIKFHINRKRKLRRIEMCYSFHINYNGSKTNPS